MYSKTAPRASARVGRPLAEFLWLLLAALLEYLLQAVPQAPTEANDYRNPTMGRWAPDFSCFDSQSHLAMNGDIQLRSRAPANGQCGDCAFCGRPCGPDGAGVQVWW